MADRNLQIEKALKEIRNRKGPEIDVDLMKSYLNQMHVSFMDCMNRPINALLPEGLLYSWVEATITLYDEQSRNEAIRIEGLVSSIQEGDEKIDFDNTLAHKTILTSDDIVNQYKSQLFKYRLPVW